MLEQNKIKHTKKNKANKSQKSFHLKTSTCRDGTLKNQPNKIATTPQYFYTIPTSCAILPTMHTTKPFAHQLHPRANKRPYSLQLASYHHTTHPSNTPTCHQLRNDPVLLTPQPSTYKTALTCHAQQLQKPTPYTPHSNMPHRLSTDLAPHSFYIPN